MADENIIDIIVRGAEQAVRQITGVSQAQQQLAEGQDRAAQQQVEAYNRVAKAAEDAAKAQIDAAGRARDATTGRFLSGEQIQQRVISAQTAALSSGLQNPQRLQVAVNAAQFTAARNAILQQQAAAQSLQGRLQALGSTIAGVANQLRSLVTGSQQASQAMNQQANATSNVQQRSITYLSVLSAIHAASFLATNQTFSMIGSFVTLGAAFGKMGLAAGAAGLALGGLLGIFGTIQNAAEQVQQTVISGAETLLKFGAGVAATAVAAGVAGVKIAGSFETQLASVRAFGGATTEQLAQVSQQATELSNRFGVSAASVVEATSLFAKAGGTVQDAINGATEAIIKLQVASQGELSAAQAAVVTSAALKQFSLSGDQAGRVADNLAAAMQASALSALGVQQAFIQAAPGAAALGLSLEDVSAGVALLGDQLVKGTITGTAFKQFLLDIIKPSKEAQQVFAQYGIAIQDASGNALPFIDILGQLHDKLADITPLQREQALATIFGSRAFLAANIFTQEGADGLQRYREELAKTTTSNIVDVLLLPMEKQLDRVRAAAENTGRAFGGPLLAPVRSAAVQVVDFLQSIQPLAQLAGEAIAVVLTQQGFGALQVKIDQLVGHNALASFLIELVNSARNVADVITSQIIPAIGTFLQTLATAGSESSTLDAVGSAFNNVNQSIQNIGAAVAAGIVALGQLTVEFVKGEGAGGRLRDVVKGVADAVLTNLAASFTTAAVTIQAAIVAMPIFARVALLAAQAALQLAGAMKEVALKGIDIVQLGAKADIGRQITDLINQINNQGGRVRPEQEAELKRLNAALAETDKQSQKWKEDVAADADAAQALAGKIAASVDQLDKFVAGLADSGKASAENARIARTSVDDLTQELIRDAGTSPELLTQDELNTFIERAGAMKQAAIGAVNPILQVFEDAKGQISTALDNINAAIEEHSRDAANRKPPPDGVIPVNQAAVDKELAKIDNSFRRLATQIDHTARDAQTKVDEAVRTSLERIDDIVTNAQDRLKTIERDRQEAINDLLNNTAQQRADRAATTDFQQAQEDRLTIKQRELDKEATEEQRTLERSRTDRQHHNEDLATLYQQNTENVEKAKQREIDLNERAFSIIQQAQDTAFSRSQETALTAFQRSQQAAAEARQFGLQIANAKTPDEVAQLTKQRQQSLQDTKFQQGQEDALTRFRNQQEDARTKFQNNQSLAALQFRQSQEDAFTKFRRDNEKKFQDYRRGVEAFEKFLENAEDDELLRHRQGNEDTLTAFRRQQAKEFQKFQDGLEDAANNRRIDRINRESGEQAQKAVDAANKQLTEIGDALTLNLGKQADQLDNQLQNIIDQADNLKESLKESLPPNVFGAVAGQIDALTGSLRGAANQARTNFKDASNQAQQTVDQAIAVGQAQVELARPIINPTQQVSVPTQVIAVQTIQAASIVLPPGFTQGVAAAVQLGISQTVEQGILPSEFNIDLTPVIDPLEGIRRGING